MKLRSALSHNILNILGWRTKRKVVVIESDDWGSIRMPSRDVYSAFVSKGFDVLKSDYNRLDALETNEDLELLYEVLRSHTDSVGNNSIITANFIVGNPDFEEIKRSDFNNYFVEPISSTLNRYPNRERVEKLYMQGYAERIFYPQFHGREHVNVVRWMEALRKKSPDMMFTFDNETTFSGDGDYNFMEVLDYNTPEDLIQMKESLVKGLDLFEKTFGFRSKSFIPPCYTWDSNVEEILAKGGVKYIQGIVTQLVPTGSFGNYKRKYHFLGNRNKYGQYFLIRNAFFEPALTKSTDPVGECMHRINLAFRWHKPAIIGSHRINFMGSLDEKNRADNLRLFDDLLKRIVKVWPDVEFMSSDMLGDLIAKSNEQVTSEIKGDLSNDHRTT